MDKHSKSCSKCGEVRFFSEFVGRSDRKDGCGAECKLCRNARARAAWARNPEYYREKHKQKVSDPKYKAISEKWRNENRDHINKNQKKYRKVNPEMTKAMSQRFRDELSDSYIKHLMTRGTPLHPSDVPADMVELHRINLKIKRKIKELKA